MNAERRTVRIFEVGPRDGLQNESVVLTVATKLELIRRLVACGIRDIEIGSFVHPKWVPQMADTDEVAAAMPKLPGLRLWGLVPNLTGYERARDAGIEHISVVMSATETHNRKNLNRSCSESLIELQKIIASAKRDRIPVRGYISTAFGCPYEGVVPFAPVLDLAESLLSAGADEISLGDTIGVATPHQVRAACREFLARFEPRHVALHLHDTHGLGPANAFVALEAGIATLDSSVGGLGGCPYAPGAAGNLGTEDLVHLAASCGVDTGVDLDNVIATSAWIESVVKISPSSKLYRSRVAACALVPTDSAAD